MRKKCSNILWIVWTAVVLAGCRQDYQPTKIDGFTQGTTFHIVIRDNIPARVDIRRDIDSIFRGIERSMSLYDPNSLLSRINRNETDSLDTYIEECIRVSEQLSRESGGLFDITVKPLTAAYGFAGEDATQQPNVDSLLQFVGYEKISIENGRLTKAHPGVQIDLNAVAQGYTVDVVAGHFRRLGLRNFLVEMGGEVYTEGQNARDEAWLVGVDSPKEGNYLPGADVQVKLPISGRGLATSGNYRKFYEDESGRKIVHTVNPRTGQPVVSRVLSATVVAPNATLADIYGTYIMVSGLESGMAFLESHPELDAFIVWSDDEGNMQTYQTKGLQTKE